MSATPQQTCKSFPKGWFFIFKLLITTKTIISNNNKKLKRMGGKKKRQFDKPELPLCNPNCFRCNKKCSED